MWINYYYIGRISVVEDTSLHGEGARRARLAKVVHEDLRVHVVLGAAGESEAYNLPPPDLFQSLPAPLLGSLVGLVGY